MKKSKTITRNEMVKSKKKHINLYFKDGDVWKNVYIDCFLQAEDDDEENMLEIGKYLINQSEIEKIEILD